MTVACLRIDLACRPEDCLFPAADRGPRFRLPHNSMSIRIQPDRVPGARDRGAEHLARLLRRIR